MTIPAFTPFKNPIIGKKAEVKFRVLNAGFGDGYSQVTPDGLNTKTEMVQSLIWNNLSVSQAASITSQFDTFNGTTFSYQIPGDSAPVYWRCSAYSVDDADGIVLAVSATLTKAFDLT